LFPPNKIIIRVHYRVAQANISRKLDGNFLSLDNLPSQTQSHDILQPPTNKSNLYVCTLTGGKFNTFR